MGELNYQLLSKKLKVSPKALERIVGSTRVELNETDYELGLRLERKFLEGDIHPKGLPDDLIITACQRYEQTCPAVYQWLSSGDFKAEAENTNIPPAVIIHACRNAGRLRAELIRE